MEQKKLSRQIWSILFSLVLMVGMLSQMGMRVYADESDTPTIYEGGTAQASSLKTGDILYTVTVEGCDGYTFKLAAGSWVDSSYVSYGRDDTNNSETTASLSGGKLSITENSGFPVIYISGDQAYPYYNGGVGNCWKVDSVEDDTKTIILSGYKEPQVDEIISSTVSYINFTAPLESYYAKRPANSCIKVGSKTTTWEENRWYVVTENVTIKNLVTVSGTANLILMDGATLTAAKGIALTSGNTLNIYAQTNGTGTLITTGGSSSAGIGGFDRRESDKTSGTLNIYGGRITSSAGSYWAAGIGGGFGKDGGTVSIYGGEVTATGGSSSGAGIGAGGDSGNKKGKGGTVSIYGGTVIATGIGGGKGIGAGNGNTDNGTLILGDGVTLYGSDSAMPEGSGDTDKVDTTVNTNVETRNVYMKAVGVQPDPTHVHEWSYTAEGAVITAICTGEGDCDYKTNGIALELKAPTVLDYDGTAKEASVSGYPDTLLTGLDAAPSTIIYYKSAGAGSVTISGAALSEAPVGAGGYVAQVTWGEQTASLAFTIAKAGITPTVSIDSWKYGETAKTPSVEGNTENGTVTYTYAVKGSETFSETVPTATGEYTVKASITATDNYDTAETTADFTIAKKSVIVTADKQEITYGDKDAELTYKVTGLVNGETADKVFTGTLTRAAGTDAGTYKITQGTLKASDNYTVTFTGADYVIKKATQSVLAEKFTSAEATTSNKADGKISGFDKTKAYQYSTDGGKTWTDVPAGATSIDVKAGTYQIRYAADKNHEAGAAVTVTVDVKKADVDTLAINAGFKVTQSGSKITIKWGKVEGADGYEVYVAYCGKDFSKTPAKRTTTKTSAVVTKVGGKKINLKKNFKVYVKAIKKDGSKTTQLAKTITGHIVGRKNTKYTNAKSITLTTKTISIAVGKTSKIKAKTVLVNKKKKQLGNGHAAEFRYASADESIATVDKNGKVTGVSAGTTKVYVYSRNGLAKAVSVTVK